MNVWASLMVEHFSRSWRKASSFAMLVKAIKSLFDNFSVGLLGTSLKLLEPYVFEMQLEVSKDLLYGVVVGSIRHVLNEEDSSFLKALEESFACTPARIVTQ